MFFPFVYSASTIQSLIDRVKPKLGWNIPKNFKDIRITGLNKSLITLQKDFWQHMNCTIPLNCSLSLVHFPSLCKTQFLIRNDCAVAWFLGMAVDIRDGSKNCQNERKYWCPRVKLIDFFFFRLKIILVTFNYSFNERFLNLYCWIDFCIWFYTTVTRNIQTNSSDMTTIRSAVARIRTLSLTHAGKSFYPLYNRRSQFVTKCIST